MESKLFSVFDVSESKEFPKNLKVLVSLPNSVLKRFAGDTARFWLAPSKKETRVVIEDVAKEVELPFSTLYTAFSISEYFLKQFLNPEKAVEDTPQALVKDLKGLNVISSEEGDKLLPLLLQLEELAVGNLVLENLKKQAWQSSGPCFIAIDAAINYRPVFSDSFDVDSNLEDFEPKCLGIVSVATITLGFDGGPIKEVCFQADKRGLKIFIDNLRALEKEFQIADKYLRLKSTEGKD
jgi:hypothetical protein